MAPVQLLSREPRAESREPRAESREPRAESREPRAESREPRAESREPRAESREPRAESREPRAESREPRAESREPRAESREPRAESREPRAESREPRAESREPRAESREPRAESREPRAESRGLCPPGRVMPRLNRCPSGKPTDPSPAGAAAIGALSTSRQSPEPAARAPRLAPWRAPVPLPGACPAYRHPPKPARRAKALAPWRAARGLLLLACAALTAPPARAVNTELWSATLVVKNLGSGVRGCSNGSVGNYCSTTSSLSDDDFVYNSSTYTLRVIFLRSTGRLDIEYVGDLPRDRDTFTFHVGNDAFAYANADFSAARRTYWDSSGLSRSTGDSTTLKITRPGNTAATGVPTISGTEEVGQTLTASKGTIADTDGLTKADNGEAGFAYCYQWISVGGGTETDISGATNSTYTLVSADQGKTVKVKVSFQDDDGSDESRTSAATASVAADTTPPTLVSAVVTPGGLVVALLMSEEFSGDAAKLPPTSAFSATADGETLELFVAVPNPDNNGIALRVSRVAPARPGRFRIRSAVARCGGHAVPSVPSPASLATSAAWLLPPSLVTPYGKMWELHGSRLSRKRHQFVHQEQLRILQTKRANVGLTGPVSAVVAESKASVSLRSKHGCPSVVEES